MFVVDSSILQITCSAQHGGAVFCVNKAASVQADGARQCETHAGGAHVPGIGASIWISIL